jgi:hypothetical protein
MAASIAEGTDNVRRFCDLMIATNGRLTAFGNQLIESHIRLREQLDRLRDGTYAGTDLRTHCLAFCAVAADGGGLRCWASTIRNRGRCWPSCPKIIDWSRRHSIG